jgi:hypothetical protein
LTIQPQTPHYFHQQYHQTTFAFCFCKTTGINH